MAREMLFVSQEGAFLRHLNPFGGLIAESMAHSPFFMELEARGMPRIGSTLQRYLVIDRHCLR
jgi:hypothetical protein